MQIVRTGNGARSAGAGALRAGAGFATLPVLHSGFAHCTMKTQLFLDLQESGSAPPPPKHPITETAPPAPSAPPQQPAPVRASAPPVPPTPRGALDDADVPRRRPAVWQGPAAQHAGRDDALQRADAGTMQRAPDTAARGLGIAIESWADRAARSRSAAPEAAPRMPQPDQGIDAQRLPRQPARRDDIAPPPVTASSPVQARGDASPDPADVLRPGTPPHPRPDAGPAARPEPYLDDATIPRLPSAADEIYWHARRRRIAPARRKASAWDGFWPRRLAAWSIAGGLLAAVAAGGLWLYEKKPAAGAHVAAAVRAPAPTLTAPAASGTPAAPQAIAPATTAAVQPTTTTDIVRPVPDVAAAAPVPASPAPVDQDRTVRTVETPATPATDVESPRRAARQPVTARKRPAPKTPRARAHDTAPAANVAGESSARQRREELLMQCRAHGYDERRCFQHACTMTRYGLVCRG